MSDICDFGCGLTAVCNLRNGRPCCAPRHTQCPAVRAKSGKSRWHGGKASNRLERVPLTCTCGAQFTRRRDAIAERERAGKPLTCTSCSTRAVAEKRWANTSAEDRAHYREGRRQGAIQYNKQLTPEQRSSRARIAGSANTAHAVHRQWEAIKREPAKTAQMRLQRGATSKAVWEALTPEQRAERLQKMLKMTGHSATGDAFIASLRQHGLVVRPEQPLGGFVVDGLHASSMTVVEFYGDFWHCRPARYPDPDAFLPWLGRTVKQQWARDRKRLGVFYQLGYRVVIVWESDWIADPEKEFARVQAVCARPREAA